MGVVVSENKKGVLFSEFLHMHNVPWRNTLVIDPAVGVSYFELYNGKDNKGFYTDVCYPQDWLLKE